MKVDLNRSTEKLLALRIGRLISLSRYLGNENANIASVVLVLVEY